MLISIPRNSNVSLSLRHFCSVSFCSFRVRPLRAIVYCQILESKTFGSERVWRAASGGGKAYMWCNGRVDAIRVTRALRIYFNFFNSFLRLYKSHYEFKKFSNLDQCAHEKSSAILVAQFVGFKSKNFLQMFANLPQMSYKIDIVAVIISS